MNVRLIVTIALLVGSAYGGMRYEARAIQQTCEDQHAQTVINGTAYLCLTAEQANAIQRALRTRGV